MIAAQHNMAIRAAYDRVNTAQELRRAFEDKMTSTTYSADTALATALDAWPIFGGSQGGIVSSADALVNQLADGTDLNELWSEFQTVMELQNKMRTNVASLLSYYTTDTAEVVP